MTGRQTSPKNLADLQTWPQFSFTDTSAKEMVNDCSAQYSFSDTATSAKAISFQDQIGVKDANYFAKLLFSMGPENPSKSNRDSAWIEIDSKYRTHVCNILRKQFKDADIVDAAWLDTVLKFVKGQIKVDICHEPLQLLLKIAKQNSYDQVRKNKRRAIRDASHGEKILGDLGSSPWELTAYLEEISILRKIMDRLPNKQKEALQAIIINDLTIDQYAVISGKAKTTAFRSKEKGLENLSRALKTYGFA